MNRIALLVSLASRIVWPSTKVGLLIVHLVVARQLWSQDSLSIQVPDRSAATVASDDDTSDDDTSDPLRAIQRQAMEEEHSEVAHWGVNRDRYSSWTNHSNRLIPVYTYGLTLNALRAEGSVYADRERLQNLYGLVPKGTHNPTALYYDQTDLYRLQMAAVDAGYSNIILIVFDGMDWQTTRAAALYKRGRMVELSGRGRGLAFQDYRRVATDFGLVVTSALLSSARFDVNAQTASSGNLLATAGYDPLRGGEFPWHERSRDNYLIGLDKQLPHTVTDSASSATSIVTGRKTYNGAINVLPDGTQLQPIARTLQQEQDFRIGVVTNVPVSHATPAAAYANNVSRKDYQDLSRDLIGLPSAAHRQQPLPGVDVLIGGGWGEESASDRQQGENYLPGNLYLHQDDLQRVDVRNGGQYTVVQRQPGSSGREQLLAAAQRAADQDTRLIGYFGTSGGHLPFQTADGRYDPTIDVKGQETYSEADVSENPTLADMTRAALLVLEQSIDGFWLMVEAGDVDWANHANNLDNSIGAVLSGEQAFQAVTDWVEENNAWDYTAVIVTADHGHFLVIDHPQSIVDAGPSDRR